MNSLLVVSGAVVVATCTAAMAHTMIEVGKHRRGESLLTRAHLLLRVAGCALLVVLASLLFCGARWVTYSRERAPLFIGYWLMCALLTVVLFCVLILDSILLSHRRREAERELIRRHFRPQAESPQGEGDR